MRVLDDRVSARRRNHEFYKSHLNDFDNILFLEESQGVFCNR